MKKCNILFLILSVTSSYAQGIVLEKGEINTPLIEANSLNYSVKLKGLGVIEKLKLESPNFIVNLYPFGYKDFIPPETPANIVATALSSTTIKPLQSY